MALKKSLPSLERFRLAYRVLKYYLEANGLFGARFGYIGGIQLQIMLAHVCMNSSPTASAETLVTSFFRTFALDQWNFATEIVMVHQSNANYRRSSRECMVVLSIERPRINTTASVHRHAIATLQNAFAQNHDLWTERIKSFESKPPFRQFTTSHTHFIKLDISFWGPNCMVGRAFVGWLESRLSHVSL